jgi:glycine/serine hydroxymethyltransferase
MIEKEMNIIGRLIAGLIERGEEDVPTVKEQVLELCRSFPLYP